MLFFFFNDTATTEIYTLSLHDALPILFHDRSNLCRRARTDATARVEDQRADRRRRWRSRARSKKIRSEEHTSELQSHSDLVCRLLLEKKKKHTDHDP